MENGKTMKGSMVSALILLINVYKFDPRLLQWKHQFENLLLSEFDIRRLYSIFRHVDVDGSGTIDILEMLMFLDIERTNFSQQIFSIMDEDTSGTIDFREFVISCWNYATLGDEALVLFGFDLYDRDCSNVLDASEILKMLQDLYGRHFDKNKRALKLHHDIEHGTLRKFDPVDFREFAKNHPALFFPAFEMQRLIQTKVLGKMFWKRHAEKRLLSSPDGIVRVRDIIGFRTKVLDPPSHLHQLHPSLQSQGLGLGHGLGLSELSVHHNLAITIPTTPTHSNNTGKSTSVTPVSRRTPTSHTPTHTPTPLTESSITLDNGNVLDQLELDEPTRQFIHQHQMVENVLEITNTRGHRANHMKAVQEHTPHAREPLTPLRIQQKRQEMVDHIINKCSDPPADLAPLTGPWVHNQDRIQTRQMHTWKSDSHMEPDHQHKHHHHHHKHHHHHDHDSASSDTLPPPSSSLSPSPNSKWSSLLQLQTILITKPKKDSKGRRSTFSLFGHSNRVAPLHDLMDANSHPIANAIIETETDQDEGNGNGSHQLAPLKKKNKKRRYSV